MEERLHILELIPSLLCRVWSKDTGCPSPTTLPAVKKCNTFLLSCLLHIPYLLCVRYGMMRKCWEMSPENRPSFKELTRTISKYIERIAGYLEIGFNPFTVGGGGGGGRGRGGEGGGGGGEGGGSGGGGGKELQERDEAGADSNILIQITPPPNETDGPQ